MSIWKTPVTPQTLADVHKKTLVAHVGIEFLEIGDDFMRARMPVDERTRQPMGLLHGGASVVLAETLASCAANFAVDLTKARCVGLEINANHVRSASEGYVTGIARPIHLGRTTQIWEVRITGDDDKLICVSRVTMAVLDAPGHPSR